MTIALLSLCTTKASHIGDRFAEAEMAEASENCFFYLSIETVSLVTLLSCYRSDQTLPMVTLTFGLCSFPYGQITLYQCDKISAV